MLDTHYQAIGYYAAADQLAISRRAAKSAELLQAARDRNQARKAERKHRRAARRNQESYTTAV